MPRLSVLIPVYNEERTIAEVVRRVGLVELPGVEKEVILVDDASKDGSAAAIRAIAAAPPPGIAAVKIVSHEKNRGKGAAVRTAIAQATGEVSVIQDADLEYDPKDLPTLLAPVLDGRADAVFGSRFLGGPHRVLYFWHYVANRALTVLSNMLTNYNCSDMETGYKAFKTKVLVSLGLRSDRFGIEPELVARLSRGRHILYETPISYSGRTYEEGKKITWRDGVAALWWIVRYRFFP
ncbi:MAG TPA: glycosyltransferase family 2 protein [Planctomycetota bacterium]|nr:glycosyltransferase family 2 protein [Planctomycetota bacterium]